MRPAAAALVGLLFSVSTARAQSEPSPEARRVVVRNFGVASEALADEARLLTEAVLVSLAARADVRAISEAELELLWAHADELGRLSAEECERRAECLAALTQATDADLVLAGQLGRFGDQLVATLSLSDARKVVVHGGASCWADDRDQMKDCLQDEVGRLLGVSTERAAFRLAGRSKVLVLDTEGHDVPAGVAASLTQLVAVEMKAAPDLEVLGWAEVKATLDYSIERARFCDEDLTQCFAEIGGALGVDYLLQSAVGQLDGTYVLHMKLIDVQSAEVAHRVAESYRGPTSHLAHGQRYAVRRLLGQADEGDGALDLVSREEAEGRLLVDEAEQPGVLNERRRLEALAHGKHTITVHAQDYFPFHAEAYVFAGESTRLDVQLQPLPSPWYKKWWFWTAVGATVVAGSITTFFVLREPDGNDIETRFRP